MGLSRAADEISAQFRHEDLDVRGTTAPGLRPLIHAGPPVLARRAREPRQQVDVQVRDSVPDHCRVHVLGPGDFVKGPARPCAPPADALGLGIGQVGQARCMP